MNLSREDLIILSAATVYSSSTSVENAVRKALEIEEEVIKQRKAQATRAATIEEFVAQLPPPLDARHCGNTNTPYWSK
jgi:hypothetical protein